MESPKYYLEPYQVFILKELLLRCSKNKKIDKVYSYNYADFQYYKAVGSERIVGYLLGLSEKKFFSIKEPQISEAFAEDLFLHLENIPNAWIPKEGTEKAQAIVNRINTTRNYVLTMEEFEFLNTCVARRLRLSYWFNESNEELSSGDDEDLKFKKEFSCDAEFEFKMEFNEKGTELLRKYLDDYITAFVNDELISREAKNYSSYQNSAASFKRTLGTMGKVMGINLNIKETFFYRDMADSLKDALKEMAPSSESANLAKGRFWETLIAMEKEGYLKIIDIWPKIPFKKDPPVISVQLKKESQLENESDKKEQTLTLFPTPTNTTWKQISIRFTSNDAAKIKAGDVTKKVTFAEMGFKDDRKGDMPDSLWGFLKNGFGKHNGEISFETEIPRKDRLRLKKNVQSIRKRLKTYFGIAEDPFESYRKVGAYRTKFQIADDSQGEGYTKPLADDEDSFEKQSNRYENDPRVKKAKFYDDKSDDSSEIDE